MNTLSWLIYAADASQNARSVLGSSAAALLIFGGIGLVMGWAFVLSEEKRKSLAIASTVVWATFLIICGIALIVIPSSKTIYMIAASEAGEQVVTSPEAVEMMGDLKAIIKKRLKEELGADQ